MKDNLQVHMNFPPGFLWGTATAAHQVEGGNHNSWSVWENLGGGRVFGDHVSGNACEWWTGRAEADFERAASMNNTALRFSVEWSRIEPQPGEWDDAALARYSTMIDELLARGMVPMVTLHHFTNPIWLEERGGWLHEDTPRLFARFAEHVARALGDRVTLWCTINEPMVYAWQSYMIGRWPPGRQQFGEMMTVVTHLVNGHAAAYRAIKAILPAAQVGFAKHQISFAAGTPIIGHAAAWLLSYLFNELVFTAFNGTRQRIPGLTIQAPEAHGTLDWVGLQYYARQHIYFKLGGEYLGLLTMGVPEGRPRGPEGWGELAPDQAFDRIAHLYKLVRCPIYITEMGVPDADDSIRPGYLARTLRAVWKACMHSYPVKGFFFWSLVDNFEWAEGYDPRYRFGLYGVDFATQQRTEHRSARLYRAVCEGDALTADIVREHAPEVFDDLFPVPQQGEPLVEPGAAD